MPPRPVAEKTVYALATAGEFPAFDICWPWRIKRAEFASWIDPPSRGDASNRDDDHGR